MSLNGPVYPSLHRMVVGGVVHHRAAFSSFRSFRDLRHNRDPRDIRAISALGLLHFGTFLISTRALQTPALASELVRYHASCHVQRPPPLSLSTALCILHGTCIGVLWGLTSTWQAVALSQAVPQRLSAKGTTHAPHEVLQ